MTRRERREEENDTAWKICTVRMDKQLECVEDREEELNREQ